MTLPPHAPPAPTWAGDARDDAVPWSTYTDRRYSRSVVDDVGENVGETHRRSELEASFAKGGDRAVRLAYERYGSLVSDPRALMRKPEHTTRQALEAAGISDSMITRFFRPRASRR